MDATDHTLFLGVPPVRGPKAQVVVQTIGANPHSKINHNTSFPSRNSGAQRSKATYWNPTLLKVQLVDAKERLLIVRGSKDSKTHKGLCFRWAWLAEGARLFGL